MEKKHFILGGDLQKSLAEGYVINYKSLFRDAYVTTKKHYLSLISACIFTILVLISCYQLTFGHSLHLSLYQALLGNYVIALFIAPPLLTGLQMMGINHSIGLKTKSTDLFNYFRMLLKLSLVTLMITVINNLISLLLMQGFGSIGMALSIVVLLYLNMSFSFVYPLIVEKKLSPRVALILSFKLIHKNLLQFTILFIFLAALFVISLLPYGIGLFLFVPFYFNLMGIIYRELCGVGVVATTTIDGEVTPSDKFDA